MSRLERLIQGYTDHITTPWPVGISGIERVIFVVYPPADELKLRTYIDEFELRTREAGHGWRLLDLTDAFPQWMASHPYRDKYFRRPRLLAGYTEGRLSEFTAHLVEQTRAQVAEASANTVVALAGMSSLFGVSSVSAVVNGAAPTINGRLVVFFPGEKEHNIYRLLDARDGWDYMAHAITAD